MSKLQSFFIVLLLSILTGCATRSISNSDYDAGSRYGGNNPFYQGELSEFDVLGIDRGAKPSDEDIAKALSERKPVSLKHGSTLMLIQSGAPMPDDAMTKALGKSYSVVTFTGVPATQNTSAKTGANEGSAESYARSLRLAAARSGSENIAVYWGALESARENLATSSVSWVPVVGWMLPDERERMRIRLKIAVIDVRTGQWELYSPEPIDDHEFSNMIGRRKTDQSLVTTLKEKAYAVAADDLRKRFDR